MLCLIGSGALAQSVETPKVLVFGAEMYCRSPQANEPMACATELLRHVRYAVAREFIARHGLGATSAELTRLVEYNRAFERHDRAQRARKLRELEARLATNQLASTERSRLEEFRRILARMARFEADVDAGIETRETLAETTLQSWIETAKLNAALYARYGGVVGIAAYGPYAHGAFHALIAEHIERRDIQFLDDVIATSFSAALDAPPQMVHTQGAPDFKPFWERPLSPSYLPD
jgi:hypothetical protein